MKHRHHMHAKHHGKHHAKHHAKGGKVEYYSGAGSNVEKEAEEKHQMKRGGRAKHHHMGKVHGKKGHHRLDKRARGGRTNSTSSPMAPGSARHPYSSAHHG